jgi:thiamine-phosphate pyrophosphorylase
VRSRAPRVVVVTDPSFSDDAIVGSIAAALAAAAPGDVAVQLRDKRRDGGQVLALAVRLAETCRRRGAAFVVNDRLDIARAVGADGAHLGAGSVSCAEARALLGRGAFVTVAAHATGDVIAAREAGADAVLLSPIFASPGKGPPIGPGAVTRAREAVGAALAVYALGGVTADNAGACVAAGATGVAAIRAVLAAPDPTGATRALLAAVERGPR